ncbi:MAG: hydantoinase B/oxoprolinase family protein [Synechococcus sp.]
MGWHFWVDRGGTFTDLIGCDPEGHLHVRKVLSDSAGPDPAVAAMRDCLGLAPDAVWPDGRVDGVRLGTTVATNALLESAGTPLLLLTNTGLADLLRIGDQHRTDLFALNQATPASLAEVVVEVPGRVSAGGEEVEPFHCPDALRQELRGLRDSGLCHAVVALMHAHRNPEHERAWAALLRSLGFEQVTCSHQVSAMPRLVPRGQTALAEGAVAPVLRGYLDQVQRALGVATPLRVMTSSGALQDPQALLAKDTILSGPAAGMVGAIAAARAAGFGDGPVVGFDMGGTSTDVFCVETAASSALHQLQDTTEIAGLQLLAPRLAIATVAAGGGSVLQGDGDRLQVGPRSAGARPGPACYRAGGPLTITDANLLLGRLQLDRFPAVFGAKGDQAPDLEVVQQTFAALAEDLGQPCEELAEGALQLAIERMADAIRRVSLHRGQDIRGGVLVAYGGASGQHACRLADELGLESVLLHPMAGVLSAYGMGQARQRRRLQRHCGTALTADLLEQLPAMVCALNRQARLLLEQQGDGGDSAELAVTLDLRYAGADQTLTLPWHERIGLAELIAAFQASHRQRYGYCIAADEALVLEMLNVELIAAQQFQPAATTAPSRVGRPAASARQVTVHWRGRGWSSVPLIDRESLCCGESVVGPALIAEATGCIVLEPGWTAVLNAEASLLLKREAVATDTSLALDPAAVRGELFRHRVMAIAQQMGERLRQSSRSVNIRERLDFSCALFDRQGALVANAPHIPVHLGSMGDSVRDLLLQVQSGAIDPLQPGDTLLSNDPFHGGTHLPDITAITPVFCGDRQPSFFVASRGHHADVGGISPGSMPSFSRSIADEGLLLRNLLFVRHGQIQRTSLQAAWASQRTPPRNPEELLADLQAQVAANQAGVDGVQRLVEREGLVAVSDQMAALQQQAAGCVRRLLQRVEDAEHQVSLDDGARLAVKVRVHRAQQRLELDFSASSAQQSSNFNAPLAVTRACVLYVIRCLLDDDIPLNDGCFTPVDLVVPTGTVLNPQYPAAVVAGNVEVSQALCNLLFGAFGVQAASQGTMNNLSFGDGQRQYYETIAGGGGAGDGFDGSVGLQSHMTNSRLTDPEVLEARYPVRLERFAIRSGSGGSGDWCGGDGLERTIRFLEPMTLSLISGSRSVAPFGLHGAEPGACGVNGLLCADGSYRELPGAVQLDLNVGDAIVVKTPGGGGYNLVR